MNSRQRVIHAIEMRPPDRVPLTHATLPGAFARYGDALHDLYRRYPSDVCNVGGATSGDATLAMASEMEERASGALDGSLGDRLEMPAEGRPEAVDVVVGEDVAA